MTTRLVLDCTDQRAHHVPLPPEELAELTALREQAAAQKAVEDAEASDLAARRATVWAELQALRDATTLAAVKGPLLRILTFLLKRLGERGVAS